MKIHSLACDNGSEIVTIYELRRSKLKVKLRATSDNCNDEGMRGIHTRQSYKTNGVNDKVQTAITFNFELLISARIEPIE